ATCRAIQRGAALRTHHSSRLARSIIAKLKPVWGEEMGINPLSQALNPIVLGQGSNPGPVGLNPTVYHSTNAPTPN
ncbi:hypothetical protein ElyMa_001856500, partial [Elysia marginata]